MAGEEGREPESGATRSERPDGAASSEGEPVGGAGPPEGEPSSAEAAGDAGTAIEDDAEREPPAEELPADRASRSGTDVDGDRAGGPSFARAAGLAFGLSFGVFVLVAAVRAATGVAYLVGESFLVTARPFDAVLGGFASALVGGRLYLADEVAQLVLLAAVVGLAVGLWAGRRVLARAVGTGVGAGAGAVTVLLAKGVVALLASSSVLWTTGGALQPVGRGPFPAALVVALVAGAVLAAVVAAAGTGLGRSYGR